MQQNRLSFHAALALTALLAAGPAQSQTARPTGPVGVNRPPTTAFRSRNADRSLPARISPQDAIPGESLDAEIVARVDDDVILLAEVLQPVRGALEQEKKIRSESEYRQIEWEILQRVTRALIERKVLLNELELRVPDPAVITNIQKQIEGEFEKYLDSLVAKNQMKDRQELIDEVTKGGMTLARMRSDFVNQTMAEQFLNQLVRSQVSDPIRADLLRYYREHLDEFTEEAGAVWSHIQVSFGNDKEAAKQKILAALEELKAGAAFADVARKYSDGPTAISGGAWTLTSPGSYADPVVDKALFSLPVGELSQAIVGSNAYHIVRVEKRNDGTPTPFAQVQQKIKAILRTQGLNELRRQKLEEIMARHYVESIFDEGPTDLSQAGEKSKLLR